MHFKLILTILFCALTYAAFSQDAASAKLAWNAVQATSQKDNSPFAYNCSFITASGTSLSWIQGGGKKTKSFSISSVSGQWSDITTDGQIIYNVSTNQITGSFEFSRVSGQLSVHMKLSVSGNKDQDYIFNINSVTPVN
jgi:hypothetical protein